MQILCTYFSKTLNRRTVIEKTVPMNLSHLLSGVGPKRMEMCSFLEKHFALTQFSLSEGGKWWRK